MFSWKGNVGKSGGIATNIGIHFFDMLSWIFGGVKKNTVHLYEPRKAAGFLELRKGRVKWFLSIDRNDLPVKPASDEPATYRSVTVDGKEIEFSGGFSDLHTESYRRILAGEGFTTQDVLTSVRIVSDIRSAEPTGLKGDCHQMLKPKS